MLTRFLTLLACGLLVTCIARQPSERSVVAAVCADCGTRAAPIAGSSRSAPDGGSAEAGAGVVADSSIVRAQSRARSRSFDLTPWRSAIENYVPSVGPDNQTPLDTARVAFAGYLNAIHNRVHPLFTDTFLLALDRLPAGHPLNDQQLATELEIILNQESGNVVRMGVIKSSGIVAFDIAALDSFKRAAPFGAPPREITSPDGNVYLHWVFHRNKEACSTLNARPFLLKADAKAVAHDTSFEPEDGGS